MKKFPAYLSVLTAGLSAMIIQIILIRELLVVFTGNELSIGIFLSQWLLAQAAGSMIFRKIKLRHGHVPHIFMVIQICLASTFPVIIYAIRTVKNMMGLLPGESVSMISLSVASFMLIILPGLLGGGLFNLSCRLLASVKGDSVRTIARVYTIEAIGSLIGGILVTYVCLNYLNPMDTAFTIIMLNLFTVLLLHLSVISALRFSDHVTIIITITMIIISGIWISGGARAMHQASLAWQWQNYEVTEYHNSIYNNTVVLNQGGQTSIVLNGIPVAFTPHPEFQTIEEMTHFPMLLHPDPRRICLVGTTTGEIVSELLKHNPASLDVIEPDRLLHEAVLNKFSPGDANAFSDPRVHMIFDDGRSFLATGDKIYDVILLNLHGPANLQINRFYTREFFDICAARLDPGGLVLIRMPSGGTYLSDAVLMLNQSILGATGSAFNHRLIIPGEMALAILGKEMPDAAQIPDLLAERLQERNITTKLLSAAYFTIALDSARMAWYNNAVHSTESEINSDLHPISVMYNLLFWASSHEPALQQILHRFLNTHVSFIILSGILIVIILLQGLRYWTGNRDYPVVFTIFTSGFFGMGASILLTMFFQTVYGYLYYWIGLLIAVFMAGLALGSGWQAKSVHKEIRVQMIRFECGFILLCLVFLVLLELRSYTFFYYLGRYLILLTAFLTGLLVGGEFPLATALFSRNEEEFAGKAGLIYGADLTGAALAGIIISVLVIPVYGMLNTLLALASFKIFSLGIFAAILRIKK